MAQKQSHSHGTLRILGICSKHMSHCYNKDISMSEQDTNIHAAKGEVMVIDRARQLLSKSIC